MKNILITGANGQLGNEMRILSAENSEYTYFFTDVAELDICNEQAVQDFVKANNIHVIVNCAAYTPVDNAEENVELCTKLNADAVGYLANAAEANGAEFIQISTDYVFDGTAHIPYQETEPTCQNTNPLAPAVVVAVTKTSLAISPTKNSPASAVPSDLLAYSTS